MSGKKSKQKRKDTETELKSNNRDNETPIGQITIDVYKDGGVVVNGYPPDLRTCMHILAEAQAYCAAMFVLQVQMEAMEKEESKIITLH